MVKPKWVEEEMTVNGVVFKRKTLYALVIRYVIPVVMTALFLQSTGIL